MASYSVYHNNLLFEKYEHTKNIVNGCRIVYNPYTQQITNIQQFKLNKIFGIEVVYK